MRSGFFVVPFLFALAAFAQHPMQDPPCNGVIKGIAIGQDGQPARGIELVVFPTEWRDFDYVFPTTRTNDAGEYRFDIHLCPGRYAVYPEDEKAGYPVWSFYLYNLLYGGSEPSEVDVRAERPEVELRVDLPPKPALLQIRVINRQTKADIPDGWVKWKAVGKPKQRWWVKMFAGATRIAPVPPDRGVLLHVTADGFREWAGSKGKGKLIHLAAGNLMTLEVELEPRQR